MKGNYKLKWHKFTIYFALFTLTAITLFAAVPFFIGKTHAVINGSQIIFNNAQIYAQHPMMQTYDILFGIFFASLSDKLNSNPITLQTSLITERPPKVPKVAI